MAVEFKKVVTTTEVKTVDMAPEVAQDAIDIITQGVEKFGKTQDYEKMSQFVKEGCDKKFGPTWHCCIGEGFSFDVTSQQKHSLYMMYAGYLGIMLWKC